MSSFLVYVWRGRHNVAAISTEDEEFVEQLREWVAPLGYKLEVRKPLEYGSEHK